MISLFCALKKKVSYWNAARILTKIMVGYRRRLEMGLECESMI